MPSMKFCSTCNIELTENNWNPCHIRRQENICKVCNNRSRIWKQNNPEKLRASIQKQNKETQLRRRRLYYWKIKIKALDILGRTCIICGESDMRVLQINHLNGLGKNEGLRSDTMYRAIVNGTRTINDLDLRCANCNWKYEYERGARLIPEWVCEKLNIQIPKILSEIQGEKKKKLDYRWKIKLQVQNMFGGKCIICGISDPRVLHINHKNGRGGKKDIDGTALHRAILSGKRDSIDLDLRCVNHNFIYEYEKGAYIVPDNLPIIC